jgi:hypothetical protein
MSVNRAHELKLIQFSNVCFSAQPGALGRAEGVGFLGPRGDGGGTYSETSFLAAFVPGAGGINAFLFLFVRGAGGSNVPPVQIVDTAMGQRRHATGTERFEMGWNVTQIDTHPLSFNCRMFADSATLEAQEPLPVLKNSAEVCIAKH